MAFFAVAFISTSLTTGCAHKLEPGVYQGDKFLYESENAINTFHEIVREFLIWEMGARTVLPAEVSRAADFIRLNEKKWLNTAHAAHDAYVQTPGDPNAKQRLMLSLNLLKTALREAAAYMAASKRVAPNNGLRGIKPFTLSDSAASVLDPAVTITPAIPGAGDKK